MMKTDCVDDIVYRKLNTDGFSVFSLDNFIRRQEVYRCWRKIEGEYRLTPVRYTEDWNLTELRSLAERILNGLKDGNIAYAAYCAESIVGFAYLEGGLFGSKKQYIDLAEFYVSLPYRNKGIGGKLFNYICKEAKNLGAEKLYISAHSAEDSISAYKKYGCTFASEINLSLAEKEPCDLQLEFDLNLIQ